MPGFDLVVGSWDDMCRRCADGGYEDYLQQLSPGRHLAFGKEFSASEITHLGSAVAALTAVGADFGNEADRKEPLACLFVDRLTPAWVQAASRLPPGSAEAIGRQWLAECLAVDGDEPAWAKEPTGETLERLLALCRLAVREQADLLMIWEL